MEERPPEQPAAGDDLERLRDATHELPLGFRMAAAWSWRLIVIGAAVAAVFWLVVQVRIIIIPLFIAILLTALLAPVVGWFERRGGPRWLGVITALLLFFASVGVLVTLIVTQSRSGFDDLFIRSTEVWDRALEWVDHNVPGMSVEEIDRLVAQLMRTIEQHQTEIWTGALGVATTAGQVIAGLLLVIFSLIFLLIDGKRIWFWVLGFLPARAHAAVDTAGRAGWISVGQYVRVQIFVAFVDAVGIGLGAALLGVPLPIPIAILVFLGSFIPFLGAIVTGAFAVFIALIYNGPVNAAVMLGVVILVNQIEGHVLQPLVMGTAVRVHPLGVVLAVSTGALLAGIPGALFAVPVAAAANSIVNALVDRKWDREADPVADFHRTSKRHKHVKQRARLVARLRRREGSR